MTNEGSTIKGWNLDNSYARLPKLFFTNQKPDPVESPRLILLNEALAESLGMDADNLKSDESMDVFAGNELPPGAEPIAQAYAGHQFGHFTMLGDGRALLLGEQVTPAGERFDIQLKGSGRTPYSRGGDGRAALGPMLREYIISEAMYALEVPTNRSLAVVTTGEEVYRETALPGAILTRVASSHIRFGTFQFAAKWGTMDELKALIDYTITRHYPELEGDTAPYRSLLKSVMKRYAALIAKWQHIGFIHGVMNTDNMTLSGETIDYGPCAFMNVYDPDTVFSSIDREGRYAYGNQPYIGAWNLSRFAETLLPFLHEDQEEAVKIAQEDISEFSKLFKEEWLRGMRSKLGLFREEEGDEALIDQLLGQMKKYEADYTNTFYALTLDDIEETVLFGKEDFENWYEQWKERRSNQEESEEVASELMRKHNPVVIPRNHRVEEAIEAAVDREDYSVLEELLNVLKAPYDKKKKLQDKYCEPPSPSDGPYQTFCGT